MLAGHETTANTINWIIYELCLQPQIQMRLRKEIHEKEKLKQGDEWTWQELEGMPYLVAVIKVRILCDLSVCFY